MPKTLTDYISNSNNRKPNELLLFKKIPIRIINSFIYDINIKDVLETIEKRIPSRYFNGVEAIYVGDFDFLESRELTSLYSDGAIYISPAQTGEQDLFSDIVHEVAHSLEESYGADIYGDGKHEVAHSLEESYGADIYGDGKIEEEFLKKRNKLLDILVREGYGGIIKSFDFEQLEYSPGFDSLLYKEIGYHPLTMLTLGLFVSPYGITSLREYFANVFEEFYSGDKKYSCKVSPSVCEKIHLLQESMEAY